MNEASRKLTAVIVDDEELARAVIREMLRAHPEIEVLGECANGFEAVKMVSERKPDLLFLDIQMPKARWVRGARVDWLGYRRDICDRLRSTCVARL